VGREGCTEVVRGRFVEDEKEKVGASSTRKENKPRDSALCGSRRGSYLNERRRVERQLGKWVFLCTPSKEKRTRGGGGDAIY